MLSKSKGQILRVATALHVLFNISTDDEDGSIVTEEDDTNDIMVPVVITERAILAAINFVELCCQQTAYMAGRGDIEEDIQLIKSGMLAKPFGKFCLGLVDLVTSL